MENKLNIDEWVVLSSPGGRYLGRVAGALGLKTDTTKEDFKKGVLDAISNGDVIELDPSFDFMAPLRPVQGPNGQVGMQRDPVIVPTDFTLETVPVYVKAAAVYFVGDLQKQDKETYKSFVEMTLDTATNARAQRAGIEMPYNRMPSIKGMPRG